MPDPDLVFVHGGRHGAWCWSLLIDHLRQQCGYAGRLVALDVPGCGTKRGRDTAALSLADVASELNTEVRRAGLDRPLLIGHSMAGLLLPHLWAGDPTLYAGLIHLATSAPREGQTLADMMGRARHGVDPERVGWPVDPDRVTGRDLAKQMFGVEMSPDHFEWVYAEVLKDNWPLRTRTEPVSRAFYDGSAPCSYIVTRRDPILPVHWQGRFAERLGAQKLFLLDTPHEPFVTHPAELADLLRREVLPAMGA